MKILPVIPKRFKFARGVTLLFLALSMLLLVYTYYRAEVIFQGNVAEKYFKYYVISLVGIFFWGAVLWLKDEIKLKVVLVSTSLIVGIYLVEIAIYFIEPGGTTWDSPQLAAKHRAMAHKMGIKVDTRTISQVYRDLRSEGVDAVPFAAPSGSVEGKGIEGGEPLMPLSGVSRKITIGANESGKFMIYPSDRYGFNNPDSEWDSPQVDWVLTGDSFVQGYAVQPGEDIARQIHLITGENVLNLGMAGNGPLLELAVLKEYAESIKPKIVLWFYYEGNDRHDLAREASVPLLMGYLQPEFSQNLIHRKTEINNRILKDIEKKLLLSKTRILRLYYIRRQIQADTHYTAEDFGEVVKPIVLGVRREQIFSKILTKARDRTAAWDGKLYFIYLPNWKRYTKDVQNHDLHMERSEVIGVAKDLNIPVIDIHQVIFANHPDPLSLFPFREPGHYTAEGYSEVAKAVVLGVTGEQKPRNHR